MWPSMLMEKGSDEYMDSIKNPNGSKIAKHLIKLSLVWNRYIGQILIIYITSIAF